MNPATNTDTIAQQPPNQKFEFASILIVDDERFDRTRLRNLCRDLPFTTLITEADSMQMLREKLSKDHFDLILLDYHLTDGTGLHAADLIRANSVNRHAAVVMVTGTDQNDIAIAALKSGFSDYLTKGNLDAPTLINTATTALERKKSARNLSTSLAERSALHTSLQSFSRACTHDIKPIVSRIMRQMRDLRVDETLSAQDRSAQVENIEGSLRRLWAFLDGLDQMSPPPVESGPTIARYRQNLATASSAINLRVPTQKPQKATPKPPSIFRRRPD
ncbi:MAG: response regulator [Sulfitobacter sp.]